MYHYVSYKSYKYKYIYFFKSFEYDQNLPNYILYIDIYTPTYKYYLNPPTSPESAKCTWPTAK